MIFFTDLSFLYSSISRMKKYWIANMKLNWNLGMSPVLFKYLHF